METYYTCLRVKIRNRLSASCHGFVVAKANMHLKSSCYLPPNYNTPSKQKKTKHFLRAHCQRNHWPNNHLLHCVHNYYCYLLICYGALKKV